MPKQKNHTNRNMSVKAHKNGIKKPKRQRYTSTKGVCYARSFHFLLWEYLHANTHAVLLQIDHKFLRNQKYAKRFNNKPREKEEADE